MTLQPRAGQILALAFHELAVNAVEHGILGGTAGQIEVSWNVVATEPEVALLITWTELGASPVGEPARTGFGTQVLTQMIPYDLHAETDLDLGPHGLRCRIRLLLPERVARIDLRTKV